MFTNPNDPLAANNFQRRRYSSKKKLECVPETGDFKLHEFSREQTAEQDFSDHKSVMSSATNQLSRFGS